MLNEKRDFDPENDHSSLCRNQAFRPDGQKQLLELLLDRNFPESKLFFVLAKVLIRLKHRGVNPRKNSVENGRVRVYPVEHMVHRFVFRTSKPVQ